jgi:hypothetical protein
MAERLVSRRGAPGIVIRHAAGAALAEGAAAEEQETRQAVRRRIVEVRDLEAERAGRVYPCLDARHEYRGCIGYERCRVLCWASRPGERQAVVRVQQATSAPCRTCGYAREVYGDVALVNGRELRLMECRRSARSKGPGPGQGLPAPFTKPGPCVGTATRGASGSLAAPAREPGPGCVGRHACAHREYTR